MSTATALPTDSFDRVADTAPVTRQARETYPELLARLSRQSVTKHFDAYADVDWDHPDHRIEADDPRWEIPAIEPLGATDWYQSRPAEIRRRIGLEHFATLMKNGIQFEAVLKRGIVDYATRLPNGSPEFRYCYHEVIEEAQHSLMFQEFVNRTGCDVDGLPRLERFGAERVVRLARRFPELFFLFVLGGEEPIDYSQRQILRSGAPVHPLVRRIMQIHLTEEARHICFAHHFLRQRIPQLGPVRRFQLSVRAPILLHAVARLMLEPSAQLVRRHRIPRDVLRQAYAGNPLHHARRQASLRRPFDLCREVGLLTPVGRSLWRRLNHLAED